jgi:Helix-turn-helix domain
VSIGETLAEARQQAGLTVSQVSHQTRIREAIIRGIEQDDYSGCGGDFYARGHIRAMARAIGADPVPLIQEFDETNQVLNGPELPVDATGNVRMDNPAGEPGSAAHPRSVFQPLHRPSHPDAAYPAPSVFDAVDQVPREPDVVTQAPYETEARFQAPYETETDLAPRAPLPRQPSRSPRPPRPAPRSYQPPRRPPAPVQQPPPRQQQPPPRQPSRDRGAGGSWISSVFDSAPETPGETTEPNGVRPVAAASYERPPRRENRVAIIAVAALAVVGLLAYLLTNVFSANSPKPRPAAVGTPGSPAKTAGRSPGPTPGHTASPPVAPAVVTQTLHPASAQAFGPGGAGHGDNPQYAAQAIDTSPSSSWQTDWYNTPRFGNLQPGTGLLLNMGKTVTITSAAITLGPTPGADLQLRAGSSASLAGLRPVAHANNAGGVVRLRLSSPVHTRYLLVWFTKLPPDSTGTYQVKVFNITLKGTR